MYTFPRFTFLRFIISHTKNCEIMRVKFASWIWGKALKPTLTLRETSSLTNALNFRGSWNVNARFRNAHCSKRKFQLYKLVYNRVVKSWERSQSNVRIIDYDWLIYRDCATALTTSWLYYRRALSLIQRSKGGHLEAAILTFGDVRVRANVSASGKKTRVLDINKQIHVNCVIVVKKRETDGSVTSSRLTKTKQSRYKCSVL